jgi:hypothetical protein
MTSLIREDCSLIGSDSRFFRFWPLAYMLTHGRSAAISLLPFKGRQGSQPGARPKIAVAGGPVRDPQLHHVGSIPVGRRQVKEMLAPLRIGLGHGQPFKLLRALAAGLCTVVRFAIGHGFKSETSFAKIATGIAARSTTITRN